jgi:hypothetical protein
MNGDDGFYVYKDYVGLKTHFNVWKFYWHSEHDYRLSEEAFAKRNDKHFFKRLYNIFPKRNDRLEFLISCFLHDKRMWIGDMFEEELRDLHRARMTKRSALVYTFRNDAENIADFMIEHDLTLKKLLLTNEQRPLILKHRHQILGGVSEETLALFDKFFGFTRQVTANPLWEEERLRYHKYNHLIEIERIEQIKPIINQLLAHPSVSAHGQTT